MPQQSAIAWLMLHLYTAKSVKLSESLSSQPVLTMSSQPYTILYHLTTLRSCLY